MIVFYFTKSQRRIAGQWYGKGEVSFYYQNIVVKVSITDYKINKLIINRKVKKLSELLNFIDLFLYEQGYNRITKSMSLAGDRNSKGLTYNLVSKIYNIKVPDDDELYFPAELNDALLTLEQIILFKTVQIVSLTKLIVKYEQEDDLILNICPAQNLSSVNLISQFILNTEKNTQISSMLNPNNVSILDLLTFKVYNKDLITTLEETVINASSTEMYQIVYSSGDWPSETNPKLPGDVGSFSSSLIKYKELNPTYPLDLNMFYMSETINLSRFYKGLDINLMLTDSKKIWDILTTDQKVSIEEELLPLMEKYKELGTVNQSDLKIVMEKWGTSAVQSGLINYQISDKKLLLESFLYSVIKLDKNSISNTFLEMFGILYQTLHTFRDFRSELEVKTHVDRLAWLDTIHESWFLMESRAITKESPNLIAYTILLSFILKHKEITNILTKN